MAKSQKWGATALRGYGRQGLAELRAALPLADSPIAQPTNYEMPGMATPGEVAEARRDESMSLEEEPALIGLEHVNRDDIERDDREMDRD